VQLNAQHSPRLVSSYTPAGVPNTPRIPAAHNIRQTSTTPTTGVGREGVSPYETLPSPERTATNPPEVMELTNEGAPMPWPLKHTYQNGALPSSAIPKETLQSTEEVLASILEGKKQLPEEKAGTVCQILAREAVFGKEIMSRCTPGGSKDLPALPKVELYALKTTLFQQLPLYWRKPEEFEVIWKSKCWVAIEQACHRLRRNK